MRLPRSRGGPRRARLPDTACTRCETTAADIKGHRMKLRTCLLSTVAAIGLGAVALPAAADDFFFDATAVGAFGAPTYGKVSLSQVGTGVLFNVTLDPEFNDRVAEDHTLAPRVRAAGQHRRSVARHANDRRDAARLRQEAASNSRSLDVTLTGSPQASIAVAAALRRWRNKTAAGRVSLPG